MTKFDNWAIQKRDEPVAVADKFSSAALHDLAEADEEVSLLVKYMYHMLSLNS